MDDAKLLLLLKNNSTKNLGFTELTNLYKDRLYWHIRRMVVSHEDAQDVTQDTFINIYKYIGSFKGDSKLLTWMYKIATNECIKLFRSRKSFFVSMDSIQQKLVDTLYDQPLIDADQILLLFHEAILRLPEKQRIVFNLRYFDDLSYDEISTITNSSVGTLKTNYHYAYEKVKEYIKQGQ